MRSLVINSRTHWKSCRVFTGLFLLCGVASTPSGFAGPSTVPVDVQFRSLVDYYQGRWACDGHFANGKAISSEEMFESWSGGTWLHEVHDDHPPFSYHAHSVWGVDLQSHSLTLTIHDNFGGVRLFVSHDWSRPSITFEPQPILGHTGRPERFTLRNPATRGIQLRVRGVRCRWQVVTR